MQNNHKQQDSELPQQSFHQQSIQILKKQLAVTNLQKRQIVNNQQLFSFRIQKLNIDGKLKIETQNLNQAILYLNSAQQILQYGASCGKTIDRNLIITTLHNLACVYQRMWQLQKSSSYLQGIIYNFGQYIDNAPQFHFNGYITDKNSKQHILLTNYIKKGKSLVFYNLQYCAVSSQLKKNQEALLSATKAINLLKSICKLAHQYQSVNIKQHNIYQNTQSKNCLSPKNSKDSNLKSKLQLLKNLSKISLNRNKEQGYYDNLIRITKKKMRIYKQIVSQKIKTDQIIKRQFQSFSIANIMQINPLMFQSNQIYDMNQQISEMNKIYFALYFSISLFTMATQSRMIAGKKYYIDETAKKLSQQWKNAEIYHLMAIKIVLEYVPCETNYINHILKTFNTHFHIDFVNCNEEHQQGLSEKSSQFYQNLQNQGLSIHNLNNNRSSIKSDTQSKKNQKKEQNSQQKQQVKDKDEDKNEDSNHLIKSKQSIKLSLTNNKNQNKQSGIRYSKQSTQSIQSFKSNHSKKNNYQHYHEDHQSHQNNNIYKNNYKTSLVNKYQTRKIYNQEQFQDNHKTQTQRPSSKRKQFHKHKNNNKFQREKSKQKLKKKDSSKPKLDSYQRSSSKTKKRLKTSQNQYTVKQIKPSQQYFNNQKRKNKKSKSCRLKVFTIELIQSNIKKYK